MMDGVIAMFPKWLSLAFLAAGAFGAVSDATADDRLVCIQSALNSLGYDSGPPDGEMTDATMGAFAAYVEAGDRPQFDLSPGYAAGWCLYMVRHEPVDVATRLLAHGIAATAVVTLNLLQPIETVQEILVVDHDQQILAWATDFEQRELKGNNILTATFPYSAVDTADQFCTRLAAGWGVRGPDGVIHPGACDPFAVEFWTATTVVWSYEIVQRPN